MLCRSSAEPVAAEVGAGLDAALAAALIALPSRETRQSYRSAWRAWVTFLVGQGRTPESATATDVQAWAEEQDRAGRLASTVGARVAACRAMARRLGLATTIFTLERSGRGPTGRGTAPRLTASQARRLLGAIDRTTVGGARDYALIAVLLTTGARVGPVLRLRVGEVMRTSDGKATDVWFGFEMAQRLTPGWVYEAVREYLVLAGRDGAEGDELLWRPLPNPFMAAEELEQAGPIGVAQVNKSLRKWLEAAGIAVPERYSTGSLRGLWMMMGARVGTSPAER